VRCARRTRSRLLRGHSLTLCLRNCSSDKTPHQSPSPCRTRTVQHNRPRLTMREEGRAQCRGSTGSPQRGRRRTGAPVGVRRHAQRRRSRHRRSVVRGRRPHVCGQALARPPLARREVSGHSDHPHRAGEAHHTELDQDPDSCRLESLHTGLESGSPCDAGIRWREAPLRSRQTDRPPESGTCRPGHTRWLLRWSAWGPLLLELSPRQHRAGRPTRDHEERADHRDRPRRP
jgi:hypothetical protein